MGALDIQGTTLPFLQGLPHGARALVLENRAGSGQSSDLVRLSLQSLGLEVFLAPSTARAERILNRVPIDLLILYLRSPDERRTLDWLGAVRKHQPDLLFIAIAEQPHAELEQRCDALGAAAFLPAPVSLRTLRRCIERAFDGRRCRREIQALKRQLADRPAPSCGHEAEHQVAELWFAIFEQLLSRRGRKQTAC